MYRTTLLALALIGSLAAADQVLDVAGDVVVVQYRRLPVHVTLAAIELPADGPHRKAAEAKIADLVTGKRVDLFYDESFGHRDGLPKVVIKQGSQNINQILVAEGLAKHENGAGGSYARLFSSAQKRARSRSMGLWADSAASDVTDAGDAAEPTEAEKILQVKKAAFAAELGGRWYYPVGHQALASVSPKRLIRYPSEEAARKAGKRPAPVAKASADDGTEASAKAAFEQGEALYRKAIGMGATNERDRTYGEAFRVLTQAVTRYSALVEADPDNADLQDALRRAMQMRYGAMKYRRS